MQKYLYKKTSKESYTIGVYTTIELLKARPESVIEVILSSKGERNKGIHKIIELCKKNKTPLKYNDNLVGKLTRSDNNYAVAIFKKYSADPTKHDNHLVLIKPSDMGNTGTIIRSMTAFNLTSLIIIKPAVDIFDPKTVRSSMGSLFGIKFRYFDSFEDYLKGFENLSRPRHLYGFDVSGKKSLNDIKFEKPYSLIFGNEGEGFVEKIKEQITKSGELVKIPQNENIDSLNLSVAVGIALFKGFTEK